MSRFWGYLKRNIDWGNFWFNKTHFKFKNNKCEEMHRLQKSVVDKEKTGGSVLIRRGNFIYNTWCWQGVSSSASILQGWSARLRIYCTVFGNQDCSSTINTRLKQQTPSLFFLVLFLFIFLQNGTNNNTKYLCCWQFTKKVFWLDNCAIIFSSFFLFRLKLCEYGSPESLLDCNLGHAGCDTF